MSENKENKSPAKQRKGGPNPVLIGITLVVAAVAAWFVMESRKSGPARELEGPEVPVRSADEELVGLGRTLAIGPSVAGLSAEGTTAMRAEDVEGMEALLDGRDVEAFVAALEKRQIQHVVIDPSIAVRNPIPQNTVRNRLALGRPAWKLSAKLMSRKFFLWKLGPAPPELSTATKRAMIAVARQSFAGVEGVRAPKLPSLFENGAYKVFLVVRPVQSRHLSFHSTRAGTLYQAARELGEKAREYWDRKEFSRKLGSLERALSKRITLEMELAYDHGTFVGPRDKYFLWRVIEPGIHGVRIVIDGKAHHLPPWYCVANNYRTVTSMLERVVHKYAGKDEDYWKDAHLPIERHRSIHWREDSPGGEIEDLYRCSPRVPSTAEVTRDNLLKSLSGLAGWIADNQTDPSGRYVYRYYPTRDEENDEYNMVRHALGPLSMAMAEELVPDPSYREKAEAGMRYIEDHIRWGGPPRDSTGRIDESAEQWMGKPLPGEGVAILEFDANTYASGERPDWSAKMGAVAVAILGYTQAKLVGWELSPEREKVLDGLAKFLLYMQQEDGTFHHYYVSQKNRYYGQRNSIYPGEILYAVARLYGETGNEDLREAFRKSMKSNLAWFEREMDQKEPDGTYAERRRKNLVQFQPWIAMAMEEMHRHDPDPSYVEASNLVSEWIIDTYEYDETRAFFPDKLGGYLKVLDELPAMHSFVYTEGTAASYVLARRAAADEETIQKLRKGCLLTARFLIQMQARPGENDYYYPNPSKARGAVRYCMNHNKQRIDYTYHALSSVYRILHAATPEDYELVQSIEMPPRL